MANLATVTIQFKSSGAGQVKKDTDSLLSGLKNIAGQFGIASTAAELAAQAIIGVGKAIIGVGKASFEAAVEFDKNIRALALYQTNAQGLEEQLGRLQNIAKQPGLTLSQVLSGVTYLEAAGFSAKLAESAIKQFGNALALAGKGSQDLAGVSLALGQIKSKGIISAEEVNQIAERIPQVRQAMIAAFGTGSGKELEKQGKTATQFIEGITKELGKLPRAQQSVASFIEKTADQFKFAGAIIGKGFFDLFKTDGLDTVNNFFNILREYAKQISTIFTAFSETDLFKRLQFQFNSLIEAFREGLPAFQRFFAAILATGSAAIYSLTKIISYNTNFWLQLFSDPVKLAKKEWDGLKLFFEDTFKVISRGFQLLVAELTLGTRQFQLFLAKAGFGNKTIATLEYVQQKLEVDRLKNAPLNLKYKPTPFAKMAIENIKGFSGLGVGEFMGNALNTYADIMQMQDKFKILPKDLQFGIPPEKPDTKAAADDDKKKKEKQLKALQEIANNTKKANDLTLRDLTYGGGQLAAQGLSRVEQSSARQVSSPQLNASNDIVRGVEKMIRMYSNSNNLNFSFRRS